MILSKLQNECLHFLKNSIQEVCPSLQCLNSLVTEIPKDSSYGDFAIPLFSVVKEAGISPQSLVSKISNRLQEINPLLSLKITNIYLNFFFKREVLIEKILSQILEKKDKFYTSNTLKNKKIMLEFSSPNTNKPLHLGHIRNNCIGESLSRLLKNSQADVFKVNIINDRGIHICKSMIAYQQLGQGKTPESENIKSDHFVGDFYVRYTALEKENPDIEKMAQKMLIDWENHDLKTMALWQKMNDWAINGIQKTYEKTNISFDKIYFESKTYKIGKEIVMNGIDKQIFFKAKDGSIRLDLSELNIVNEDNLPQEKVFLRSDGTSVYITQDLGTAVERRKDFKFDKLIYVVANEQQYHFQTLFYALKKLEFSWANDLYHLSYGMVNLPDGKMKSREGTVVDADDLIESLKVMAEKEIAEKGRLNIVEEDTASKIALAALHYYLLKFSSSRDIIFDPQKSLSFTGNTGPYLQYTLARAHSLLQKEQAKIALQGQFRAKSLSLEAEWQIIKILDDIATVVNQAACEYTPHLLANRLYDLAKSYNKYYHDVPVLTSGDLDILVARCILTQAVKICLEVGFYLLNIPVLYKM